MERALDKDTGVFSSMLHWDKQPFLRIPLSSVTLRIFVFFLILIFYESIALMKNLKYHFPTCYTYSVKEPIGELNLKRALDEDTGVFSSFFSLLLSSSPLGQTAVSGNSTLHQ